MKRIVCLALLVLSLAAFGCSSRVYTVTTQDGRQYQAAGQPEYQDDTGMYTFENLDGQDVTIPKDEVKEIVGHKK